MFVTRWRPSRSHGDEARILIFGDFRPARLAAPYECAFRELGHEVFQFDARPAAVPLAWPARIDARRAAVPLAWPARTRILHRAFIHSLSLRRRWSQQINRTLVNCCQSAGAAWAFMSSGEWLMPKTVCVLKAGIASGLLGARRNAPEIT